jgi:hypothetical protein
MVVKCKTKTPQDTDPMFGLAPRNAKENDLVCILYSCSVPVVLREYEKSDSVLKSQISQLKTKERVKAWNMWRNAYFRNKCIRVRDYVKRQARQPTPPSEGHASTSNPPSSAKRKCPAAEHSEATTPKRPAPNNHAAFTQSSTPRPPASPPTDNPDNDRSKSSPKMEPKKEFYKMIGECYVHGMMNGEAIEHQNVERLPKVLFEIR